MTKLFLISLFILISFCSSAQFKKQRVIIDNNKKFLYSDSAGVTQSYINYFSDSFPTGDLITIDRKLLTKQFLEGKTIIYNFWFVSCPPCVAEIPALNKLVKKYQSDSIIFLAVTFDNENRIRGFLQNHDFNFQIISLSQIEIDKIKQISFYPFTAIVTKKGKLSFALFGRPTGNNSEDEIFNLLGKQIEKAVIN